MLGTVLILTRLEMQIRPLTAANHQQLQTMVQQMQATKQREHDQHKKLSAQNPYVEWVLWLVKPPSMSSGRTEYVVKRIVTAPIRYNHPPMLHIPVCLAIAFV